MASEGIIKSNFLSNFKPDGVIPRVLLSSSVTSEQISCFTTEFGRYIRGAKVFEDLILPRNLVLSYLGKFSEIEFYDSSLRPFLEKKVHKRWEKCRGPNFKLNFCILFQKSTGLQPYNRPEKI